MSQAVPELEARVSCMFTRDATPEDLSGQGATKHLFARKRVPSGQEVEVGAHGLVGSTQFNNSKRWSTRGFPEEIRVDRAVLAQTAANLDAVRSAGLQVKEKLSLEAGSFGENLFLEGGNIGASTLCIGDEFCLWRSGKQMALRLSVASPRAPCAKIDTRHGNTFTADGVRPHTAKTGQAGVFFRVLVPGRIQEGDMLKLAARPNPGWDLARVSHLLYGHPTVVMHYLARANKATKDGGATVLREEWMGTEEELRELASMPQLAVLEWKEHMVRILEQPGIGRYAKKSMLSCPPAFAFIGSTTVLAAAIVGIMLMRRSR